MTFKCASLPIRLIGCYVFKPIGPVAIYWTLHWSKYSGMFKYTQQHTAGCTENNCPSPPLTSWGQFWPYNLHSLEHKYMISLAFLLVKEWIMSVFNLFSCNIFASAFDSIRFISHQIQYIYSSHPINTNKSINNL